MDRYSKGEVAYLLALERWDAIEDDASQPDSCALLNPDGPLSGTTHVEWDPIFTIARWHDVQRARRAVIARRMRVDDVELAVIVFEQRVLQLRALGLSEREVGELLGVDRLFARRRFGAAIADVLEELGGEALDEERLSTVPACMVCAERPRARLAEQRRKVRGGWKILKPERLSSLCAECTPAERRHRLVRPAPVIVKGAA